MSNNSKLGCDESRWKTSFVTIPALLLLLIGYPAFRMGVAYFDVFAPSDWWGIWSIVLVGHWLCAAIVFAAIRNEKSTAASIGLNLRLFVQQRWVFIAILLAVAVVAIFAPSYFYGENIPETMQSHPLGPVSSTQRFFWIAMAVSAGFVEEIVFRGYAITRLRRFIGLPAAVLISTASFALMHGPSAFILPLTALYVVSGLLFSIAFLLMRSRRLEILIVVHAAIDMALIAAP